MNENRAQETEHLIELSICGFSLMIYCQSGFSRTTSHARNAFDDARRGQIAHAFNWTGSFAVISLIVILKAQVVMPPPV